jgi:hypothetical protein
VIRKFRINSVTVYSYNEFQREGQRDFGYFLVQEALWNGMDIIMQAERCSMIRYGLVGNVEGGMKRTGYALSTYPVKEQGGLDLT